MSARPATVRVVPLEARDRPALTEATARLASMQVGAWVLGVGLMIGGAYMFDRGHTDDAIACGVGAVLMWLCINGLGSARRRDAVQGTKDVIVGVLEARKTSETEFNTRHWFVIGGVEVRVPPDVHDQFREGQVVCAERLTGSRQLLRVTPASERTP